jgi:Mg2+/Co2+ transporter CorB
MFVFCWMRRRLMKKLTKSIGSILISNPVANIVARTLGLSRETKV